MMPTMTQSGSCIDPFQKKLLAWVKMQTESVRDTAEASLFFLPFPQSPKTFKKKIPAHLSFRLLYHNEWILEELVIPVLLE